MTTPERATVVDEFSSRVKSALRGSGRNSFPAWPRRYTPRLNLRQTFVLANEFKEGDLLVGGADDARLRDDARRSLQTLRIGEIVPAIFVDDGVTETLERSLNAPMLDEISGLTVAGLKQILLSSSGAGWIQRYRSGLRSEAI